MKKKNNSLLKRLSSPTPKKWKARSIVAAKLAAALTAGLTATKALDINYPQSVNYVVGGAIFICISLVTYCQQKTEPEPTKTN